MESSELSVSLVLMKVGLTETGGERTQEFIFCFASAEQSIHEKMGEEE